MGAYYLNKSLVDPRSFIPQPHPRGFLAVAQDWLVNKKAKKTKHKAFGIDCCIKMWLKNIKIWQALAKYR